MLGILYIITCLATGYTICSVCIKNTHSICNEAYSKKEIGLSKFFFIAPASFLVGTCFVTWYVYFAAYFICVSGINSVEPLLLANASAFLLFLSMDALILSKRKEKFTLQIASITLAELIGIIILLFATTWLMTDVFHIIGDTAYVGYTVFGDFAPHVGMIRSFSQGNNFPTMYPHFTGEDVRYHFMFQFLAGNLEYLGMRIDYAFNIPSILSFLSMMSLLYVLVNKIFAKRRVAVLSLLFVLFRPSLAVYSYFAQIPKGENFFATVWNNDVFLGNTANEDWGFYNLNVYCNQRHIAFAIGIMLLVIILMLPYLYEMDAALHAEKLTIRQKFSTCFLKKGGFGWKDGKLVVFLGLLLGGIAFWNGSVLVATLAILFCMAILSNHRFDFIILAGITLGASLLQTHFFIEGNAVSPAFYFGYLADPKTFSSVLVFIAELCAPLLIFLVIFLVFERKSIKKYLAFLFMVPFIMAFTLSLTPDISVNHKWIMFSIILSSPFLAACLDKLFSLRRIGIKVFTGILLGAIILTGVLDLRALIYKNEWKLEYSLTSEKVKWIAEHSDSKDIFLTDTYSLHEVVFAGAMLYYGWPYYAWSAGYDTLGREEIVKEMYGTTDVARLRELVQQEGITYIIVEESNRINTNYVVQEEVIARAYKQVYSEGEGEWKFTIYDTRQPSQLVE